VQGDKLASGGKSATFAGANVSKEKWERIFGKTDDEKKKQSSSTGRGRRTDPKGHEEGKP
jgi:hypothetical protein